MDYPINIKPSNTANRLVKPMLMIAAVAVIMLGLGIAYIWFSGGSGQASTTISAPVLTQAPGDTRTLFRIDGAESEVRFLIHEELLGNPKTVIGATNQVAGELLVDFNHPANSQLGTVRINVRTLETDNEIRNRALRGQILQTQQYEFAEFVPTALTGLPATVSLGEPFTFEMAGNLTVHGVTRDVTFSATLTPVSDTRIEGSAQADIRYQDFGIAIPQAPGVANVSDDVRLEIDLVALPVAA
jgi:polyisoprenoid-binding protein YceI